MDWKRKYREAFPGPYIYDTHGCFIRDQNNNKILDLRGWGRLTGHGKVGLGMTPEEAVELQDEFGTFLAEVLNTSL